MNIKEIEKIKKFFENDHFEVIPPNTSGIIDLQENANNQTATMKISQDNFAVVTDEKPDKTGITEFRKSLKDQKRTDFIIFSNEFLLVCDLKSHITDKNNPKQKSNKHGKPKLQGKNKAIHDVKEQFLTMKNPHIENLKEDFIKANFQEKILNKCKFILLYEPKRKRPQKNKKDSEIEYIKESELEIYIVDTLNKNAVTIDAIINEIKAHA